MSLNTWSLIVFVSQVVFYTGMMGAMAGKPAVFKVILMMLTWVINQVVVFWYGLATHQIGFILMSLFQFVATIITMITIIGKEFANANK